MTEETPRKNRTPWIIAGSIIVIIILILLFRFVFVPDKPDPTPEIPDSEIALAEETEPTATAEPAPTETIAATPSAEPTSAATAVLTPAFTLQAITAENLVSHRVQYVLNEHSQDVTEIEFSPDSSLLASASLDGTVRIWDAFTGRIIHVLSEHNAGVLSVAFSPDGNTLASGAQDGEVILWNVSDGTLNERISRSHPVRAVDLAFSPDGSLLAIANHACFVELRKADSGILHKTLVQPLCFDDFDGIVTSWALAFAPDGNTILAGEGRPCCGGTLLSWPVDDYGDPELLLAESLSFQDLALAPDGKTIAVAFVPQSVFWTLDAETGSKLQTFTGHTFAVNSLDFSPSGDLIISGGEDNRVYLWDAHSGARLMSLMRHTGPVNSVDFAPNGSFMASASDDNSIIIWVIVQ